MANHFKQKIPCICNVWCPQCQYGQFITLPIQRVTHDHRFRDHNFRSMICYLILERNMEGDCNLMTRVGKYPWKRQFPETSQRPQVSGVSVFFSRSYLGAHHHIQIKVSKVSLNARPYFCSPSKHHNIIFCCRMPRLPCWCSSRHRIGCPLHAHASAVPWHLKNGWRTWRWGTRWAPTSYKWGYNPCKWPYKWVSLGL